MGTPSLTSSRQIYNVLKRQPDSATWGQVKEVTLKRNLDNTLGIKFETFQGSAETVTVVTKVKDTCNILQGSLEDFDRIVFVNGTSLLQARKDCVKKLLCLSNGPFVKLTVCHLETVKVVSAKNSGTERQPIPLSPTSRGFRTLNTPSGEDGSPFEGGDRISSRSSQESPQMSNFSQGSRQLSNSSDSAISSDEGRNVKQSNPSQKKIGGPLEFELKECKTSPNVSLNSGKLLKVRGPKDFSSDVCPEGAGRKTLDKENVQTDSEAKTHVKRGFSQVSDGSSTKSLRGSGSNILGIMGKSKGENSKSNKRFYHPITPESDQDLDELTPLKAPEGHDHSRGSDNKCNMFNGKDVECPFHLMQDPAVSMQDIVFDDQLSGTGGQQISGTGSNTSPCSCASCSKQTPRCKHCKSISRQKKKVGPRISPLTITDTPSDGQLSQDMGSFFVKNPHMVKWDQTKVVTIEKSSSSNKFGFNYKVKIGKNADGSVEIYTLVESVVAGGPAEKKLHVGDWIRSVNSVPVQVPMNAFTLLSNSTEESSIRLVIQRPIGVSQLVQSDSNSPSKEVEKTDIEVPPFDTTQLPWVISDPNPTSSTPEPAVSKSVLQVPGHDPFEAPEKSFVSHNGTDYSEEYLPSVSSNTGLPKAVKLPKVRIFVCGSKAVNCANLILKNSDIEADTQTFQKMGYTTIDCSMAKNSTGGLIVSQPCSNLYPSSVDQSNSLLSAISQSESRNEEEKCRSCGCEIQLETSQNLPGTVINVELFVVSDDRFFHNCCNYLFTKSSIFILTFDGAKLLRSSAGEIARLQNLSHTVRSFVEYDCNVVSCGLLEEDIQADEVSALFFTHYGHQLRKYFVSGPELVHFESTQNTDGFQQLQNVVWKTISETVQRNYVLQPGLLVLDYLQVLRSHELFLTESRLKEVIKQKLPKYQQDVHQIVLTELISSGEIISGKAAPITLPHLHKIESLVMIHPRVLLERLYWLITMPPRSLQEAEDKQKWMKVYSSGVMHIPDFLAMCVGTEVCGQYIADFMECYGLIFRRMTNSAKYVEYYIPYFAQEPSSTNTPSEDKKDLVLYVQFKCHASTQMYFNLLFNIVSQTDAPNSLVIQANNCSTFTHQGFSCMAFHQKLEDRIKFLFKREEKTSVSPLNDLFKWLRETCQRCLGSDNPYSLGPPCPLGGKCHTSSTPGLHLLEVKEGVTEMCGTERVDTHKTVKRWLLTDLPANKSPMAQVTDLPWSVFSKVCLKLRVNSPLGRDWKGLAGLMGYTVETVTLYEVSENPAQALLVDWSRSRNGTIEELIKLLSHPDMLREDIISDIKQGMAQS